MAYDIWQTCMLVPGVNADDCASWVQAWGSIAAVLIAVWVSRRQARHAEELEQARFRIANIGRLKIVLALLTTGHEVLNILQDELERSGPRAASESDLEFLQDSGDRLKVLPPLEMVDAALVARVTLLPRSFTLLRQLWTIAREEEEASRAFAAAKLYGQVPDKTGPGIRSLLTQMKSAQKDVADAIESCRTALDRLGWYTHGDRLTLHS